MASRMERIKNAIQYYRSGIPGVAPELYRRSQVKRAPFIWPTWRAGVPQWSIVNVENYVTEGFEQNALIYTAIMYKYRAIAKAPLRAYTGTPDAPELLPPSAPLARLCARPNPWQSMRAFQGLADIYLNVTGNSFIFLDRDKKGTLTAMYTLRPDFVTIIPDNGPGIKGYVYVPEGKGWESGIPILPEDMIHVKLPNPRDPLEGMGWGLSPIVALARSADVDNDITTYLKMFFADGAMPAGLLSTDDSFLTVEDVARIRERWRQSYGGIENWAEPVIMEKGLKYQRLSLTFDEMGFGDLDARNETRIVAPFGVPIILLETRGALGAATYANKEEARRMFWEDTMSWELGIFEDDYRYFLNMGDGSFVMFDLSEVPALRRDVPVLITAVKELWSMGVSLNTAAATVGVSLADAVPGGDIGYLPMNVVPVTGLGMIAPAVPLIPESQGDDDDSEGDAPASDEDEEQERREGSDKALSAPSEYKEDYTGIIVALFPREADAQRLALDIEGAIPAQDIHMTLAWLGDTSDPAIGLTDLLSTVRDIALSSRAISGKIAGKGVFPDEGHGTVLWAAFDSPQLPWFRQMLVDNLAFSGYPSDELHGFMPHLTLAYIRGRDAPDFDVKPMGVQFDELTLCWGSERYQFPFDLGQRWASPWTPEAKSHRWHKFDVIARRWEDRFEAAAAQVFALQLREILALLSDAKARAKQLKATIDWTRYSEEVQGYFDRAGDQWRSAFLPMIEGVVQEQGRDLAKMLGGGIRFDVQNLEAINWYDNYTLKFAQEINNTTKKELGGMLQQAMSEGWTIPAMQKNMTTMFTQWMHGTQSASDFEWYQNRLPPHRTAMIARTETIRASNAGTQALYEQWGVEHKEWLSTNDHRVRTLLNTGGKYDHRIPNGQQRAANEFFHVSGELLMYPGDPRGQPGNTIQCRCTTIPIVKDLEEPIAAPQPELTAAEKAGFPASPGDLEVVRNLGGTTGAQLVRDPATGDLYVRKSGSSPDHIREECLTDAAYRVLGVRVPDFHLYDLKDGPVKLSRYIPDAKSLESVLSRGTPREIKAVLKQLRKDFAADALLGNWDVAGASFDNILIDKAGKVWRIDNGSGLRFRAQGSRKPEGALDSWVTEFWTMRDPNINPSAARVFGDERHQKFDWFSTMRQAKTYASKRGALLDLFDPVLEPKMRELMGKRMDTMADMVWMTNRFKNDGWVSNYVDNVVRHSVGLRRAGLLDILPKKLTQIRKTGYAEQRYHVRDENGKLWDNMRGDGSSVELLAKYMRENGGDHSVIYEWMNAQGGSSWSAPSKALKYGLVQARGGKTDEYWWGDDGLDSAKGNYNSYRNRWGAQKWDTSFQMFHAYNYEIARNVSFERNNRKSGFIEIMRTESRSVMSHYGFQPGDRGVMKRGAAESGSVFVPVEISGDQMTLQRVPHERVIGMYFYERGPGTNEYAFYGDKENEIVFLSHDTPMLYVGRSDTRIGHQDWWKKW